jgi:hypothetical protein
MKYIFSMFLIIAGFSGLLLVFGPVLKVETIYHLNRWADSVGLDGDWTRLFIPKLNIVLAPPELVRDYALVIPAIYLQERIFMQVDPTNKDEYMAVLKEGIAHASGTSLPGQGGMGYYFAHSSGAGGGLQQKAEFYLLNKLEEGDEVQVFYKWDRVPLPGDRETGGVAYRFGIFV